MEIKNLYTYDEVQKIIVQEIDIIDANFRRRLAIMEKQLKQTQAFAHKQAEDKEELKKELFELKKRLKT